MKDLDLSDFILQDIKSSAITPAQIQSIYRLKPSYEALFSKRAQKYQTMSLKNKNLREEDFRELILQEYTFLKRPIFIFDKAIFVGNSKENISALKETLSNE
tara:strand:- start:1480 stop:1785 length:306 start_codon:yes stop_codon:yes gene_type:complete